MVDDSKIAAVEPSEKISFPTMIVGLLTKQILPDATVLGFSRSASFVNDKFLNGKTQVYSIDDREPDLRRCSDIHLENNRD